MNRIPENCTKQQLQQLQQIILIDDMRFSTRPGRIGRQANKRRSKPYLKVDDSGEIRANISSRTVNSIQFIKVPFQSLTFQFSLRRGKGALNQQFSETLRRATSNDVGESVRK